MAHHKATIKGIRQIKKRTERNVKLKSRIKNAIRKVVEAVSSKDQKAANEALKNAQSVIFKGVSKGVVKKETASRKISRLNKTIKEVA